MVGVGQTMRLKNTDTDTYTTPLLSSQSRIRQYPVAGCDMMLKREMIDLRVTVPIVGTCRPVTTGAISPLHVTERTQRGIKKKDAC